MAGKIKHLEGKGEFDYDYKNDILFFKTKEREYEKSLEIENMVLDIDKENFIVGIQIFDASKFLTATKTSLRNSPKWKFEANLMGNKVEIRLAFQIVMRNKIIEKNPIIMKSLAKNLVPKNVMTSTVSI